MSNCSVIKIKEKYNNKALAICALLKDELIDCKMFDINGVITFSVKILIDGEPNILLFPLGKREEIIISEQEICLN
jgi:uncharacterized protein YlaN (UPF0358 family)